MVKQNKSPDKTGVLQYTLKSVSELTANRRNARTHSKSQIKKIANSIKEFGFISPAIIDKDGVLVAGHGRLEAAKSLGMTEIPCLIADHLTPEQLRAYMLADNRIQLDAGWDEEILKVELGELSDIGFNIDLTGFDISEVEGHLRHKGFVDGEDDVPETPENPVSKLGDIWILGEHRVMCGDSTDPETVAKLMNGQKADMVFTDPPYGVDIVKGKKSTVGGAGSTKFQGTVGGAAIVPARSYAKIIGDETTETAKKFFELCQEIIKPKTYIIWGGNYFTDFLSPSPCWVVWDKKNTGNFAPVELAWTNSQLGCKLYEWLWNGLSRKGERDSELISRVHPTQKPVGLFEDIFQDFKFKLCFDGFLGSGSTLIACEKQKRICYGMEFSPDYVDVIVKRWQDFTGRTAILEATGEPYPEKELKAIREA